MVPYQPSNSLGAICQRLTSTPVKKLPPIISYLLQDLVGCRVVLSAPGSSQATRNDSETGVLIHKYKTQISTLLQDKSLEGRWSAVTLIKGTIEVGGWEVLQGAGGWIRGLLSILGVRLDLLLAIEIANVLMIVPLNQCEAYGLKKCEANVLK